MTHPCLYMLGFPSGKSYIGITQTTLNRRMTLHRHHASDGRPGAVYNAIRKYGMPVPQVLVIGPKNWDDLCSLEQRAIASFKTKSPHGYNLTDGGEGTLGGKQTERHRIASSKRKGVKLSEERKKAMRGWNHTEEARRKISEAGKGRIFTAERLAKMGASKKGNLYNLGRIVSPETREKIAAPQRGRKFSDATRAKMSAAAKLRGMPAKLIEKWRLSRA